MKDLLLLLFALTGGFAVSGIVSNIYRLLVPKEWRKPLLHCGVMILAGPNVMFGNATTSLREKKCSRLAYGFIVCLIGYWAFALGLLAIAIGMKL